MEDGTQIDDDPKSEAGKRTTSLPAALRMDIETHLSRFAQSGPSGRLFVGPEGVARRAIPLRRLHLPLCASVVLGRRAAAPSGGRAS
jgi:hypothetical protein